MVKGPTRRLRIAAVADELVGEVRYLNASPRGGTEVCRLPIQRAAMAPVAGRSDDNQLDAIVACSDLQGIVPGHDGAAQLLGVAVAEALEELAFDQVLPPAARTGVILAGDLYSVPAANKRGGFGGVEEVWAAFAERFAWVAGVAGNHDDVSRVPQVGAGNVHLLDGEVVDLDGLRVGGVGGIIGNPGKKMRRTTADFLRLVDTVIDARIDLLVLHEGPSGGAKQPGNDDVRTTVEVGEVGLTICGHDHWDEALGVHETGQILNVDARVVILVL